MTQPRPAPWVAAAADAAATARDANDGAGASANCVRPVDQLTHRLAVCLRLCLYPQTADFIYRLCVPTPFTCRAWNGSATSVFLHSFSVAFIDIHV